MSEQSETQHILDAFEIVDEVIAAGGEISEVLAGITRAFLDIFGCERAFLRYASPLRASACSHCRVVLQMMTKSSAYRSSVPKGALWRVHSRSST